MQISLLGIVDSRPSRHAAASERPRSRTSASENFSASPHPARAPPETKTAAAIHLLLHLAIPHAANAAKPRQDIDRKCEPRGEENPPLLQKLLQKQA